MDSTARRKLAGLQEKSVHIDKFAIAYLEGGTGTSVLLLHGFGADKDNWIRFARYLKGSYHIVAPDLPGFGDSTMLMNEQYDIDSQVKRIHEFTRAIGMTKFHIAGNSMGGLISGVYAATYPDDVLSLGLIDPGGVLDREMSQLTIALKKGKNPLVVSEASEYKNFINFVFENPPFIPGMVKNYLGDKAVKRKEFYQKVFAEARPADQLERKMMDIHAKTLIIWGDMDKVFPASSAEVLDKGIDDSQVIIMKKCGHVPMIERPAETARYYIDFIR